MSAALPAVSAPLPRSFGRYLLFDFIGKGGMAEIFLARQKTELGAARLCVVKQILPSLTGDPKFSDMLVHEAKLAARLSHANVVQVFDLGRADDRLFIAMEYVEGFDLNDLLRRCSRAKVGLPFELGLHVVREALRGLDYAHRRVDDHGRPLGIVHRDVSPSNLLVSFEGEVKVCDFGIARANDAILAGDAAHELDEAIKGKAGYMSPEQAHGQPLDARADVFAAGIILWELASGRRLYRAGEAGSLIDQARRADIPELSAAGLPEAAKLRAIVGQALAREPAARYASAAVMLRDLEDYAMAARFMTSQLQLGDWLAKTFGEEILSRRRQRERAATALEKGAPVVVQAVGPTSSRGGADDEFRIDVEPPPTGPLPDVPSSVPHPASPSSSPLPSAAPPAPIAPAAIAAPQALPAIALATRRHRPPIVALAVGVAVLLAAAIGLVLALR